MTDTPLTKREKQVRRHNAATLISLAAIVLIDIQVFTDDAFHPGVNILLVFAFFASIIVMFRTRNADEYIAAIWRSATSAAFMITAAIVVFTPFFEGIYDGYMGAHRNQDIDPSTDFSLIVMGSFFIGNAWARLRGTV